MRGARVRLEHLLHLLPRQRRLREHPPHRLLDHALGMLRQQGCERPEALVPHVARVPEVPLLLELAAGQLDLLGVHDHDEVTAVQVRRERGLVLAAQDLRNARLEEHTSELQSLRHLVCRLLLEKKKKKKKKKEKKNIKKYKQYQDKQL